jgi:hypothetical protein
MAPQLKRKQYFKEEYGKKFQGIKKSNLGNEYAHCIPCQFNICLTATGISAITSHQQSEKHKK